MTIRNVAILMLMIILIMPAAVHAHTLELLGAETNHAAGGGCHDSDNDADEDSTGNRHFDVRCCELDTPYVLPSSQFLAMPAVTGILAYPFNGRQLDGYARRIYKPPRWPFPIPYQSPLFVGSPSAAQRTYLYASQPQSSRP